MSALLLDWASLDDDALIDNSDPINTVFSRGTARHIRELIVADRTVVKDGIVSGIDLPAVRQEVLAQMRAGMKTNGPLASALLALDQSIAGHYSSDPPCC